MATTKMFDFNSVMWGMRLRERLEDAIFDIDPNEVPFFRNTKKPAKMTARKVKKRR